MRLVNLFANYLLDIAREFIKLVYKRSNKIFTRFHRDMESSLHSHPLIAIQSTVYDIAIKLHVLRDGRTIQLTCDF